MSSMSRQRFDDLDAGAAAALIGLEQRRPLDVAGEGVQRADVVERDRARAVDAERSQQRRLRALAELEREHIGAVQDAGALQLERAHQGKRERHRARAAAHICARARLVEVEPRARQFHVGEGRPRDVERHEGDAAPIERREEWLLPLGVFVQDDQVRRHGFHVTTDRSSRSSRSKRSSRSRSFESFESFESFGPFSRVDSLESD